MLWDERCDPDLSNGNYYPPVPTVAQHKEAIDKLVRKTLGEDWGKGREYLTNSNHRSNGKGIDESY